MDYILMGERIRRYRLKMGLTQEQLAEQIDLSASFLGHIERGSRVASLDTLMRLCKALEITPNDLLITRSSIPEQELPDRINISPQRLMQGMAQLLRNEENP